MPYPWPELLDRANPFAVDGLSDEVEAALDYLVDAQAETGVAVRVTCTTDHPATGTTYHLRPGTYGKGLAVDSRGREAGGVRGGPAVHMAVFSLFVPVQHLLAELIYSPAGYSIKDGRKVAPYAFDDHFNHVHAAFPLGLRLRWGQSQEVSPVAFFDHPPVRSDPIAYDEKNRVAHWTWDAGAVYAWNFPPGHRGSVVPNATAKKAMGPIRGLMPDGAGGYILTAGDPGAGSKVSTYASRDFPPEWR